MGAGRAGNGLSEATSLSGGKSGLREPSLIYLHSDFPPRENTHTLFALIRGIKSFASICGARGLSLQSNPSAQGPRLGACFGTLHPQSYWQGQGAAHGQPVGGRCVLSSTLTSCRTARDRAEKWEQDVGGGVI